MKFLLSVLRSLPSNDNSLENTCLLKNVLTSSLSSSAVKKSFSSSHVALNTGNSFITQPKSITIKFNETLLCVFMAWILFFCIDNLLKTKTNSMYMFCISCMCSSLFHFWEYFFGLPSFFTHCSSTSLSRGLMASINMDCQMLIDWKVLPCRKFLTVEISVRNPTSHFP